MLYLENIEQKIKEKRVFKLNHPATSTSLELQAIILAIRDKIDFHLFIWIH